MPHPRLPSTEAAVTAVREVAAAFGVEAEVEEDIGADRTSRRTAARPFAVADPDGSLPHEAFIELSGAPEVSVRLFPEDDATVTVEGVVFDDVPRDAVPAFLRAVYGGTASVRARAFSGGEWLVVALPGDETYRERVPRISLTPWLAARVRD